MDICHFFACHLFTFFRYTNSLYVLRPDGPRHHIAAAPSAISLCSIHAYGVTALVKAAYVVTGIFKKDRPHEISVNKIEERAISIGKTAKS